MTIWTELSPIPHRVEYVDAAGVPTRTLRAGNPDADCHWRALQPQIG